jgi:hypothetical protein
MKERRSRFKLQDADIGLPVGLKGRTSSTEAALASASKRSEGAITAELTETSLRVSGSSPYRGFVLRFRALNLNGK